MVKEKASFVLFNLDGKGRPEKIPPRQTSGRIISTSIQRANGVPATPQQP